MKPYDNYGAEYRRMIRRMYDAYPRLVRVNISTYDKYQKLWADGWCWMNTDKSATLTTEGLDKMLTEQN